MTNVTLFDNQVMTAMSKDEAVAWERQVGQKAKELRLLIQEGYEREAWAALGYDSWSECVKGISEKYQLSERHLWRLHAANQTELLTHGTVGEIPERQLRPLINGQLDPEQQRESWRIANETAPDGKLTGDHVKRTVDEYKAQADQFAGQGNGYTWSAPRQEPQPSQIRTFAGPDFYTLDTWNKLPDNERQTLLDRAGTNTFNSTNDNVEWAMWTWNPITGCLHGCEYCYARDIANRFYTYLGDESERFKPVFYPDRLTAPKNTKQPDLSKIENPVERLGKRNVFVCSMADLFGKWVPNEWIEAVLQQAWDNPQWNFLFLTKFPIRMAEFEYPDNAWIGTTVDKQWAVERAEKAFTKVRAGGYRGVAWLSCEPMLEQLTFSTLEMFDWVVMGGASRSSQTPESRPDPVWWARLLIQAVDLDIPVYMKTNLGMENNARTRKYPKAVIG